jgi:hypothetical protein
MGLGKNTSQTKDRISFGKRTKLQAHTSQYKGGVGRVPHVGSRMTWTTSCRDLPCWCRVEYSGASTCDTVGTHVSTYVHSAHGRCGSIQQGIRAHFVIDSAGANSVLFVAKERKKINCKLQLPCATTIKIHLMLSLLCRLLLVRLVDCTVNLSDFYSYRLVGKLTAFLQLQGFSQRNQTWGYRTSTFAARLSLVC